MRETKFIPATMRYDYRPLGLEQGDKVKIAAFDGNTAKVSRGNDVEFDKMYIQNGDLVEAITKSYIQLKKQHKWKYID